MNTDNIKCIVLDFAFTLCSDLYFKELGKEWIDKITDILFCRPSPLISRRWGSGECTSGEVAEYLSTRLPFSASDILEALQRGCSNLTMNSAVWKFALAQKDKGRTLALVTVNMDVFTEIVVPAHGLDRVFDVIVNSADYGYDGRKEKLWKIAFDRLGAGYQYSNSFLVEDGEECSQRFRELGGLAYRYTDDDAFTLWLEKNPL
jgi:FMN phosphatase YigB (HAD superfamily)